MSTDPFTLLKTIMEANISIPGWTTVNNSWFRVTQRLVKQIYFDTKRDHYVEFEEMQLPKSSTSSRKLHHIFVVVAAPDRDGRQLLEDDMRRVFTDPTIVVDPASDVSAIYLEDSGYGQWQSDKDKKTGCEEYSARFEIILIYPSSMG